jgi:parallel beta-helix repeat protein
VLLILIALSSGMFGAAAPVAAASVILVPGNQPTIQAGINAAVPGDTVRVSAGTWNERITIATDITVESASGAATTIVDGGARGSVVTISTGTIRGFTIRNGTAGDGGGLIASGDALIEDNSIVDNGACNSGGGIAVDDAVTIRENYFARNHQAGCSGGTGGTIGIVGASTATIVGNTFEDNMFPGGAISLFGAGTPLIDSNVIRNNPGGGIGLYDTAATITNNLIIGNGRPCCGNPGTGMDWSISSGGPTPMIFNNTIVLTNPSDAPVVQGGGFDDNVQFVNNIVTGTSTAALFNCDALYSATPPVVRFNDVYNPGGPAVAGKCASVIGVDGNRSVAPNFADAAIGNYHLSPASTLIDAGTNTGAPATDVDGDARPFDGNENGAAVVDIGFDESTDPLLVSPLHLTYAATPVGIASAAKTITLKNFGAGDLTISSISVHGANNLNFSVPAETCTSSNPLIVGESCTIQVAFTPNAIGARVATLDITGPAPVGTHSVALSGTGADPITVTPATVSFAARTVGTSASPVTVTVKNAGAATATVTSVSVSGTNAGDFPIVPNPPCVGMPLTTGMTCTIQVGFKPTNVGTRAAVLNIAGTGLNGTRHVALTGTGTAPPSGVTWNTLTYATPAYSWNYGASLGRTVVSGSQRLHLAYNTDRIGSSWASDTGPYVGAYYVKSTTGATWTAPFRLNSSTTHAINVGLAASGTHVYAVWETATKWVQFSPTARGSCTSGSTPTTARLPRGRPPSGSRRPPAGQLPDDRRRRQRRLHRLDERGERRDRADDQPRRRHHLEDDRGGHHDPELVAGLQRRPVRGRLWIDRRRRLDPEHGGRGRGADLDRQGRPLDRDDDSRHVDRGGQRRGPRRPDRGDLADRRRRRPPAADLGRLVGPDDRRPPPDRRADAALLHDGRPPGSEPGRRRLGRGPERYDRPAPLGGVGERRRPLVSGPDHRRPDLDPPDQRLAIGALARGLDAPGRLERLDQQHELLPRVHPDRDGRPDRADDPGSALHGRRVHERSRAGRGSEARSLTPRAGESASTRLTAFSAPRAGTGRSAGSPGPRRGCPP